MGWMWASSSSSSPSSTPTKGASQGKSEAPKQQKPAKEAQTTAPAATNDDYGDPEIAKFMAELQADFGTKPAASATAEPAKPAAAAAPTPSSSQTAPSAQQKSASPSWSFWGSSPQPSSPTSSSSSSRTTAPPSQPQPPTRLDPLSESLLPTTMSCRAAFDSAFHCNSLGGQWNAVYRQGAVRSCGEQWEDFWFCMRTRGYAAPAREDAIRDYHRQKEIRRYRAPGQPSSTDVWEARTERVVAAAGAEGAQPFREPYEGLPEDLSDEEWYALQIERRRRVQETLGGVGGVGGKDLVD